MYKEKFKKNYDIVKYNLLSDKFYNEVVKLITDNKYSLIVKGSYSKYGKDKACDLDLMYELFNNINYKLKKIVDRLIYIKNEHKKDFFIIKLKFNIEDKFIKNTMNSMGYIDIYFNVINYNLVIDENISDDIKKEIKILAEKYENNHSLEQYIALYTYLKSKLSPIWTIEELNNGVKNFNNIEYNYHKLIDEGKINNLQIDMIYKKFPVSLKLYFGKKER
jgi:hypothetical protein